MAIERLSKDIESKVCEWALNGEKFVDIARKIGMSVHQFHSYKSKFEEFNIALDKARNGYCDQLEDLLLTIPLEFDPKVAEIYSKNIQQILKYRNPKRYGDKVNLDMTVSVDIAGALDRAERRVLESSISNVITLNPTKPTPDGD